MSFWFDFQCSTWLPLPSSLTKVSNPSHAGGRKVQCILYEKNRLRWRTRAVSRIFFFIFPVSLFPFCESTQSLAREDITQPQGGEGGGEGRWGRKKKSTSSTWDCMKKKLFLLLLQILPFLCVEQSPPLKDPFLPFVLRRCSISCQEGGGGGGRKWK